VGEKARESSAKAIVPAYAENFQNADENDENWHAELFAKAFFAGPLENLPR
jgi:hypothetical protein